MVVGRPRCVVVARVLNTSVMSSLGSRESLVVDVRRRLVDLVMVVVGCSWQIPTTINAKRTRTRQVHEHRAPVSTIATHWYGDTNEVLLSGHLFLLLTIVHSHHSHFASMGAVVSLATTSTLETLLCQRA